MIDTNRDRRSLMEQLAIQTVAKKKKLPKYILISILLFIANIVMMLLYFLPSFQQVPLNYSEQIKIYISGNDSEEVARFENEQIYIPLNFIKKKVDESIQYDEKESLVIITTNKEVYHFPIGNREGYLNTEPYKFTYPAIKNGDQILLPIKPLDVIYDFTYQFIPEQKTLSLQLQNTPIQQGITLEKAKLRKEAKYRSPWFFQIDEGTPFNIIHEINGWYWIETPNGELGYIDKNQTTLTEIKQEKKQTNPYLPWNPIGSPIILTWEYATKTTVDPKKLGDFPSLQVVSPTWFHLKENGMVSNSADIKYVDWAKSQDYQIWALFSNGFDPELTHQMLSSSKQRMDVIKQLLSYVDLYQLDGINIDFENVNIEDKEYLVQFVRELTPLMHEKDRIVSMDVTFISLSENWSMFYDREELSTIVDYIMVMAYDEHWANSPKAGSVASLPWVEKGLQRILQEVPNDKLILGLPFYTRLWIEETNENGEVKVSSKTLSMEKAEEWIKEKEASIIVDENSGQNYVEVKEDKTTYKIWIEDEFSINKRIELMKKYRLAGVAAWRRGFETEDVWDSIHEKINKR